MSSKTLIVLLAIFGAGSHAVMWYALIGWRRTVEKWRFFSDTRFESALRSPSKEQR